MHKVNRKQKMGLCGSHYNSFIYKKLMQEAYPCSVLDCKRIAVRKNMCWGHYQSKNNYGNPLVASVKRMRKGLRGIAPCEIDGCDKFQYSVGLCSHHYYVDNKYGDPLFPINKKTDKGQKHCNVSGCNNEHKATGFCNKHHLQFLRHGDPCHADKNRAARKAKKS